MIFGITGNKKSFLGVLLPEQSFGGSFRGSPCSLAMKGGECLHQEGKEMNKRRTRNGPIEPRQPLEKGAHYLRKKSCEPVLSQEKLKAELERRKELGDNRSDLERRLRAFRSRSR
jgi:hypothetical protein